MSRGRTIGRRLWCWLLAGTLGVCPLAGALAGDPTPAPQPAPANGSALPVPPVLQDWERQVLAEIELLENLEFLEQLELVRDLPLLREVGGGE